jgi:hypothetical protein
VSQEVAPFNIEFTIIEPGPTATDFGKGLVSTPPTAVYEDTPVGEIRSAWSSGRLSVRGDAQKTARAMIDCADLRSGPRRLTLGSDAYERVHAALTARLTVLQGQKATAHSTDLEALDSQIRLPIAGTRVRDSWVSRQCRRSHTGCLRQVNVLASRVIYLSMC